MGLPLLYRLRNRLWAVRAEEWWGHLDGLEVEGRVFPVAKHRLWSFWAGNIDSSAPNGGCWLEVSW